VTGTVGNRKDPMDDPMRLTVESLAYGGDAVAHAADGRAVFLSGACPGDVVTAKVVSDRGRYVIGEVLEIVQASPERVVPPCPYFGTCGGCQWQHVSAAVQLAAKTRAVAEALTRIGHVTGEVVEDVVDAGPALGYRNRVELTVGAAEDGRLSLGFAPRQGDGFVPVDACLLLPKNREGAPRALRGALRYLAGRHGLGIERVSLRVARHSPDVAVDLWGPPGPFPRHAAAGTIATAVGATTVTHVLTKGPTSARAVSRVEVLAGPGAWRERLAGRPYLVSAPSFFQVNTMAAERLVAIVLERLAADGSDRVLDLYAGVGTFTLPLAAAAGSVVAVESGGSAVRDLRRNLQENDLKAQVAPGDAARALSELGVFDAAVVDPPRAGMRPDALRALVAARPGRIVYVSCDPTTLARDVARLAESGYRLASAVPVDLFPQTYHVETVALLERA